MNMLQNKQVKKRKIVITGGHAGATTYATIEEILARRFDWEIYFIGGRSSFEGKKTKTLTEVSLEKSKVKYYFLFTGRLQRKFTFWTIPSLLKIPFGFIQAFLLLRKIDPDIILSFGGYAAFPVVVSGWFRKKPVVIHEQTPLAGRANIYSSFFATKIALARASSIKFFNKDKCVVTGNPISEGVRTIKPRPKKGEPPVILIHGGASGSVAINDCIEVTLDKLLKKYKVIHQVGELQYQKFLNRRESLPNSLKNNYQVFDVIKSGEWYKFLRIADILISRSGANIVSEILSSKTPSILIPLPFAYLNEQLENAKFAQEFGIARVIEQKDLTELRLLSEVEKVNTDWEIVTSRVRTKPSPDVKAASNLVNLVASLI